MKELRIVILEFADCIRCDLVSAEISEREAGAAFVGKCLAADNPPRLPLHSVQCVIVPADRVAQLVNGSISDFLPPPPVPPHPIPIAGLHTAMRSYWGKAVSGASPEAKAEAEKELRRFFDHYETQITFDDGRPDWMKTPDKVWTEK